MPHALRDGFDRCMRAPGMAERGARRDQDDPSPVGGAGWFGRSGAVLVPHACQPCDHGKAPLFAGTWRLWLASAVGLSAIHARHLFLLGASFLLFHLFHPLVV